MEGDNDNDDVEDSCDNCSFSNDNDDDDGVERMVFILCFWGLSFK